MILSKDWLKRVERRDRKTYMLFHNILCGEAMLSNMVPFEQTNRHEYVTEIF